MIVDSLKSLGPEEQLRHLKMRFAQEPVDGAEGEEEREIRLSTLLTMVEERGGKLSRTKEKLFSSSEPSPAKEVPKPVLSEPVGSLEVATAKGGALLEWRSGQPVFAYWGREPFGFFGGADQGGSGGSGEVEGARAKTSLYDPDLSESHVACPG